MFMHHCIWLPCLSAYMHEQLCLTLSDPINCSPRGSSVHGIIPTGKLKWVAISSSTDLPDSEIELVSPAALASVGTFFATEPLRKPTMSVFLLSHVWLFETAQTASPPGSPVSRNMLTLMSVELVMPSNHLVLCHPLFLLSAVFPSVRIFSSKSALRIRWPKYWSFSFSISPFNEYSGNIFFL